MKKVAVIVCNNGLGHIKRVLCLLRLFCERYPRKIQIDIFVNLDKLKYFSSIVEYFNKNKCRITFLNVDEDGLDYEEEFLSKYKNSLESADYVWSDNLVFPLKFRREVFLTGCFLWLDVIDNVSAAKKEEKILLRKHPLMIACKYFAIPKVKALTKFAGVGIYNYSPFCIPDHFPHKILLCCGKSVKANLLFRRNVPLLKNEIRKLSPDVEVYVDPDYYADFSFAKNVRKANFTEEMFSNISAAAIRPGIGTVCDVLLKGGKIFSFSEEDSLEIQYNAEILEKMKVGEKCKNVSSALAHAARYLSNKKLHEEHFYHLKKLDFNGLDETVDKIRDVLN